MSERKSISLIDFSRVSGMGVSNKDFHTVENYIDIDQSFLKQSVIFRSWHDEVLIRVCSQNQTYSQKNNDENNFN